MAKRNKTHSRKGEARDGGQSQRQLRVGELIRHALSEILLRDPLDEPEMAGRIVTVSEVRMTPDLKRATCFVSCLGGGEMQLIVKALARRAPQMSQEIGRKVRLKFTPRLLFQPDDRFDAVDRITSALRQPKVAADLNPSEGE